MSMEIAISFALALFLSIGLLPLLIRWAPALGLLDEPDGERKVHSDAIPRCGGLSIAIAVLVPSMLWLRDASTLFGFFLGAIIIVVFGFYDDRHELNFKWKFLGQILAIMVFMAGDVEITKTPFLGLGDLVPWLSYTIMALFILGVTNAVNLSDGLDGLAAGSSLLSLGFIGYLGYVAGEPAMLLVALATMGALLGFLRFNTHPASVFMGDTGSQFLGFVTACLAIMVTQSDSSAVSPMLAVLVVGLPILDTATVMLLRMRDGVSPFHPDKRHLHHQFLAVGLKHYQAVAALYVLNFILLGTCYIVRFQSDMVVLLVYLLFCSGTLAFIAFLKHSEPVRRQRQLENTERRNLWLRRLGWFYYNGPLVIQAFMGMVWLGCIVFSESPMAIPVPLMLVAAASYFFLWIFVRHTKLLPRSVFYVASVLTLFLATYDSRLGDWQLGIDISLGVLVVLLMLSIRMTRREVFALDNQDILVLCLLLSAPILPFGFGENKAVIDDVIRLAILLYASEYVVGRTGNLKIAKNMAAVTFFIIAVRSVF